MTEIAKCEICGEPMPQGETMFKFHGYSGPCPKPPILQPHREGVGEMTREEIVRMAREAAQGEPISRQLWNDLTASAWTPFLERFAALVAAHERESLAAEAERNGNSILAMQIRARSK